MSSAASYKVINPISEDIPANDFYVSYRNGKSLKFTNVYRMYYLYRYSKDMDAYKQLIRIDFNKGPSETIEIDGICDIKIGKKVVTDNPPYKFE